MNTATVDEVKVGTKIKVRSQILTVTGKNKYGFAAEHEYNGRKHAVTIPFDSFDNPHMMKMEIVS